MGTYPPDHDPYAGTGRSESDPTPRYTGRARVPGTGASVRPSRDDAYGRSPYARPDRATPAQPPGRPGRRVKPRWGRIALVATLVLALVAGCGALAGYLWMKGVDDRLKREDPFAALEGRPPKVADGSLNILMLGTDSRDPEHNSDGVSGERADTIVIMHIPASHDRAYLVSLPRDLWVHVPESPDGQNGDTMAKLNAAYAWGGLSLMVATVEEYTGVRMDHVALIDFGGFVRVTDALGGVDMVVDQSITSIHPPYRGYAAGPRHFNGDEALDYVRQRYQYADGDFARIRHQQEFLKALLDKAVSVGTLTNVGSMREFVSSVADAMTVDSGFSLIDLAWQFRSLRSDDLVFLVSPHQGTGDVDGQSVVFSDRDAALSLYEAMASDTVGDWVSVHGTG